MLALAVLSAVLILGLSAVSSAAALTVRQRVVGAADAAALAAADVLLGAATGEPCRRAADVAAANGTELVGCELDGYVATVSVRSAFSGIPVVARSVAGPPLTG